MTGGSTAGLHPEALLDRERAGGLSTTEKVSLDSHARVCPGCALQRRFAAQARAPQSRAARRRARVRQSQAVDAATAQWLWEVSRKLTRPRRPGRWVAALAPVAVATSLAVLWLLRGG